MIGLAVCSLIVSIIAALVAIASMCHAFYVRKKTKQESKEQLDFITYVVINSAPDPQTLQRLIDEYVRTGKPHGMLEKDLITGKYHLRNYVDVASRFNLTTKMEIKDRFTVGDKADIKKESKQ